MNLLGESFGVKEVEEEDVAYIDVLTTAMMIIKQSSPRKKGEEVTT